MVIRIIAIQRQSGPLAHGDKLWSSAPSPSRDNQVHWHVETNYGHPFPFPSRDNRVRWHAETNYGHLPLFKDFNVFRSRLLQSSLPSKDYQVCWHAKTIMVIRFRFFQDYYSLICLLETI